MLVCLHLALEMTALACSRCTLKALVIVWRWVAGRKSSLPCVKGWGLGSERREKREERRMERRRVRGGGGGG